MQRTAAAVGFSGVKQYTGPGPRHVRQQNSRNAHCGDAKAGVMLLHHARRTFLVAGMLASALRREPIARSLLVELRQLLGERLSTSVVVCAQHGKDESYHPAHSPD